MKKIVLILLLVLGIAGGGAAGMMLKPPPVVDEDAELLAEDLQQEEQGGEEQARNYIKIGRQTIVPVVQDGETRALMLFELAVDVSAGASDKALRMEPKLRDAFLRELFKMSYTGAFMTTFTDDRVIEELRRHLAAAAKEHLGDDVKDVLILDVMRQEM